MSKAIDPLNDHSVESPPLPDTQSQSDVGSVNKKPVQLVMQPTKPEYRGSKVHHISNELFVETDRQKQRKPHPSSIHTIYMNSSSYSYIDSTSDRFTPSYLPPGMKWRSDLGIRAEEAQKTNMGRHSFIKHCIPLSFTPSPFLTINLEPRYQIISNTHNLDSNSLAHPRTKLITKSRQL